MTATTARERQPCSTHHLACDCRETAFRVLLQEVIWWHSDPDLAEYNGCDTDPCLWCVSAKLLLGEIDGGEQVVSELVGPIALNLKTCNL